MSRSVPKTGTPQQRREQLEREGKRCDANNGTCTRTAVEEYDLLEADGFGVAVPDAQQVTAQTCSRHRPQFAYTGRWIVLAKREIV